jgi:hypothetical protein
VKIFCTDRVKKDITKLSKKSSYSNLKSLIYEFISKRESIEDWMDGSRIHIGNPNFICVKKRLGGSGGYRMYYLLTIKDEEITVAAIYPKTGSKGGSDLSDYGKTACIGEALDQIIENSRWRIDLNSVDLTIEFKKENKEIKELQKHLKG